VAPNEARVQIKSDTDIVTARSQGRMLAIELGFSSGDSTLIATAISELARNILSYARQGEILIRAINGSNDGSNHSGILIVASDNGPGIADLRQALRDGFSTSGSLGLGLPGVRRLMDEFEITSEPMQGTTVKVKKWKQ
jgi:serine/threonine-protein kinase RsbT